MRQRRLLRPLRAALVVAVLAAALAAGGAAAAPRVSVAPLPGAPRPLLAQLGVDLCRTFECVAFARGKTRAGFDLAAMQRARVDGVLVGALQRLGTGRILTVSLYTDTEFAELTWRIPLDGRGAIPAGDFASLQRELSTRLGPPAAVPAPPPAAVPQRRADGTIEVPLPPPPVLVPRPPPGQASPPVRQVPPLDLRAPPAPRPARPAPHRWLAVEAGAVGGRRELRFEGAVAGPAPLRGHVAPRVFGASARLELHPVGGGLLSGLGLFGAYESSLGLETTVDGAPRDTRLWRLSAGALWRSAPSSRERLAVLGSLSFEASGATVRPPVAGLADAARSGARAGLGLEVPLGGGPVLAIAGGGYTRWLQARDLIGGPAAYFPGGSVWEVDGEAGLGLLLGDHLQLRLVGRYAMTRYTFDPHPEGIYRARGAADEELTGRLSARAAW